MQKGNPKIKLKKFIELTYKKRLPNIQIAKYFNVGVSALGLFRMRNKLPPRGWSVHPMLGKRHSKTSREKMSNSLKGRKAWNKFLPDFWICKQCRKKFKNSHGQRRKYCSHKCYWVFKKNKISPGGFESGKKHWNFNPNRNELLDRNKTKTFFIHSEKNKIAKKCKYLCKSCWKKFPKLPYYKLRKFGVVFDHKIAIKLGGPHSIKNGQMLCIPCDKIKTHNDKMLILHNKN